MSGTRRNPLHEEEEAVELTAAQSRTRRDDLRLGVHRGYSAAPLPEDGDGGPYPNDEESRYYAADNRRLSSRSSTNSSGGGGDRERRHRPSMQEHLLAERAFSERLSHAAGRCRQLITLSTVIILTQVLLLAYIINQHGAAPQNENPTYGPTAYVLVDYGAKQGGLIIYKGDWWRLVTPVFLHAGLLHLAMNVYLQWQLGGFLCLLFGTVPWTLIYFLAGVYGNILSCIVDPDTVGVGSSGALMGVLAAFAIFLIFTWNKFPEDLRRGRNCNLFTVILAMTITMLLSRLEFIDGAAHGGGMLAGALAAMCLLAGEQEGACVRWLVRLTSLLGLVFLFAFSLDYLYTHVEPSKEIMHQYWQGDANDDAY